MIRIIKHMRLKGLQLRQTGRKQFVIGAQKHEADTLSYNLRHLPTPEQNTPTTTHVVNHTKDHNQSQSDMIVIGEQVTP